MKKEKQFPAVFLAILASILTACGGSSNSTSTGSQASNRAVSTASEPSTGIEADGVCNGNPDAGAVGNIAGIVDGDASTYFGAKSVQSDGGGKNAGYATVDCTMTINFGSTVLSADYAVLAGEVSGSWLDNYSQFYFYQSLHAVADVYTLDSAGQKTTLITSQEEEIEPHCIGETVADTDTTKCAFNIYAGNITNNLPSNASGVEFDIHFYTDTSTSTCFTSCTGTIEPHITGVGVTKSGVDILTTGS